MSLSAIILVSVGSLLAFTAVVILKTVYEFYKLDNEQFRDYIIGLIFFALCFVFFGLRYIVLPPLNNVENMICGYGINVPPLVGMFFLARGTEFLAKKENPNFSGTKTLRKLLIYLIVVESFISIFSIYTQTFDKSSNHIFNAVSNIFFISISLTAVVFFLKCSPEFNEIIRKIIFQYVIAMVLFIIGSVIVLEAVAEIETSHAVFMDLSLANQMVCFIGSSIVAFCFLIFYKSVNKFRTLLGG